MCPEGEGSKKMIIIPNLLSAFQLLLILVFAWAYCGRRDGLLTAGILLLFGATDMADGHIARRFLLVVKEAFVGSTSLLVIA